MLRNVSENLLSQISSVTNRFEGQGQSILKAANALESANFRIDSTLQARNAELSQTLDDLTGKAADFDRVLRGYSTSVEDSVYVHDAHRGRGVGVALLSELVERATAHGFHAVFARIVAGHDASIGLHARLGFEIVGREKEVGRKFGRFHDVVVMERLL